MLRAVGLSLSFDDHALEDIYNERRTRNTMFMDKTSASLQLLLYAAYTLVLHVDSTRLPVPLYGMALFVHTMILWLAPIVYQRNRQQLVLAFRILYTLAGALEYRHLANIRVRAPDQFLAAILVFGGVAPLLFLGLVFPLPLRRQIPLQLAQLTTCSFVSLQRTCSALCEYNQGQKLLYQLGSLFLWTESLPSAFDWGRGDANQAQLQGPQDAATSQEIFFGLLPWPPACFSFCTSTVFMSQVTVGFLVPLFSVYFIDLCFRRSFLHREGRRQDAEDPRYRVDLLQLLSQACSLLMVLALLWQLVYTLSLMISGELMGPAGETGGPVEERGPVGPSR